MTTMGAWMAYQQATLCASRLAVDGISFTWCSVRRIETEPLLDGEYTWTAMIAEIQALQAAGLTVGVKIQNWEVAGGPSQPPSDDDAYVVWLTALAVQLVALGIATVTIENETTAIKSDGTGQYWTGTQAQYAALLVTAYKPLHAAGLIVECNAFYGAAMAVVLLKSLYDAQSMTSANVIAYQLWFYSSYWDGLTTPAPSATAGLGAYNSADWQSFWAENKTVTALAGWDAVVAAKSYWDVFGWHWYTMPAATLKAALVYCLTTLTGKAHACWELGFVWRTGWGELDLSVVDAVAAQLVLTALALQTSQIVWFSYIYREVPDVPTRYYPGFLSGTGAPRTTLGVWTRLVRELGTATSPASFNDGDAGTECYAWTRSAATVYGIWRASGTGTSALSGLANPALVTNLVTGADASANPAAVATAYGAQLVRAFPTWKQMAAAPAARRPGCGFAGRAPGIGFAGRAPAVGFAARAPAVGFAGRAPGAGCAARAPAVGFAVVE